MPQSIQQQVPLSAVMISTLGSSFFRYIERSMQSAEMDIKAFIQHCRNTYLQATVTPKLHPLEDHMAPWIRKWGGVGFGVMGDQGAESIHAGYKKGTETSATTAWRGYELPTTF
jgi:hypothetical protein